MRTRRSFVALFVLAVSSVACGGTAPSQTTSGPLKSAPPPVLPLPIDPWAVAPDGDGALYLDVVAIRSSPHAAFLRDLASTYCLTAAQRSLVFERTESALVSMTDQRTKQSEGALVLKGTFAEHDAQLLLDALSDNSAAPATARMYKRIRILSRGAMSAARIGEHLLVAGGNGTVERAAALAEGERAPRLTDNPALAGTGARHEMASHALVLVVPADAGLDRRTAKSLGAIGLPRDALSGTALGLLELSDGGARAQLRIHKDSPQAAADVADAFRRKLGQLGLLARIAGLPPVLDKTEARADGAVLQVVLTASASDLEALRARLVASLDKPSDCAP